jgi:hypothetical protein
MKLTFTTICILLFVQFTVLLPQHVVANDSTQHVQPTKHSTGHFTFKLKNVSRTPIFIDSALIVLDKYDLTGAGIVQQMVAVDDKNQLQLAGVPVGKYYAGIYTYGLRKEYISLVITVSNQSKKHKKVSVTETDLYVKKKVPIPAENLKLFSFIKF